MENYTTMNLDQMSKNGFEFFNPSDSEPCSKNMRNTITQNLLKFNNCLILFSFYF